MPHNNAPLSHVAQHLRSKGRGDDTMLIHMTPNEINSLQGLAMAHGGSLTINPDTGLPEAGWLGKLLPMVLGAIATPLTGGLINPFTASLLVGAGTTAITGDLKQGLMAGLSAYGAGAVAGGLGLGANAFGFAPGAVGGAAGAAGAGTSAAGSLANMGASPALQAAATTPLTTGLSAAGTMAPIPVGAINAATGAVGAIPGGLAAAAPTGLGTAAAGIAPAGAAPLNLAPSGLGSLSSATAPSTLSTLPGAIPLPPVTPPPSTFLSRFGEASRAGMDKLGISPTSAISKYGPYAAGLGAVTGAADMFAPKPGKPGAIDYGNYYNESHLPQERGKRDMPARSPYSSYDSSEKQYYDNVNPAFQAPTVDPRLTIKKASGGSLPLKDGSFIVDARTVAELGNGSSGAGQDLLARSGGQPIRGRGDGVSDSVRARIGGAQEARVARDEVHFGPEAVKRIGGGNHKTGTQKLYAMMNKAQAARKTAKRGEDTGLRRGLA